MASGKTLDLIKFSKRYVRRGGQHTKLIVFGQSLKRSDREPRDRSLNGKKRIRARRTRYREGW
jgi:hypothetical protein